MEERQIQSEQQPAEAKRAVRALESYYRSGTSDISADFFKPCLAACTSYRRAVGYFTSSALVTWADAIPRLLQSETFQAALLISPYLTDSDLVAIRSVQSDNQRSRVLQELSDRIVADALDFSKSPEDRDLRTRMLLWLLATGTLELRFAFPEHVEIPGIYHEKIGVFDFPWGDTVAFIGSVNESLSGHTRNYESIDVFRSWVAGDAERVQIKVNQFDEIWSGEAEGVRVVAPSAEMLDRIRTIAPDESPLRPTTHREESVRRWRHQDVAVDLVVAKERGVLEMATGTGKTRTALRVARRLVETGKITTIIVTTDGNDLLRQWQVDLLRLSQELPRPFTLYRHFDAFHERDLFQLDPRDSILLISRLALAPALRTLEPSVAHTTLLIHDEVHGLGSPAKREALSGLSDDIRYRLGLSATPEREYDEEGTVFIEEHIGPVIFEFTLADAIRRGILAPFDYYPLAYEPTDDDRERIAQVFRRRAAREAAGEPMSEEQLWIELARVHKTSLGKLPVFKEFLDIKPDVLERCIVFVETREYGEEVLRIVHRYRHDFHTYFAAEDSEVLARFARGELECLLTCHRLSEGIDIRNLRSVVLFSSARSRLETIQRIGRSLRRDPEDPHKRAQIVDFIRRESEGEHNPDTDRAMWLGELSAVEPEEESVGSTE